MPRFAYSAYTSSGELETGEVQAASDVSALDALSARGLTPVSLTAGAAAVPWWQRDISLTGGAAAAAKPKELELFFATLSSLLTVRFPLTRALRFCAGNAGDRGMRRVLERVQEDVEGGQTLAAAMDAAEGFFPDRFVTMIQIGEASNKLAEVSTRIAETLAAEAARHRELRSALVYPVILIVMSFLVLALLVFYLAPTLLPVFASTQSAPPAVLRAMAGLREAVLTGWPALLAGGTAAVLLIVWSWRAVRHALAPLALRVPVVGPYVKQSQTLRLCRTLALMLSSGATLPRAVTTARETTAHPAYRALMARAEEGIVSGGSLAPTLRASPLIDPMAGAMMEAAEETDRLLPVLDRLVEELAERTARTQAQAIGLITPLLTLVIGLGVGGVILSTVSAIMTLNDVAF